MSGPRNQSVRARMSDSSQPPVYYRWKRVTRDEWPLCLDVSCPETNKKAEGNLISQNMQSRKHSGRGRAGSAGQRENPHRREEKQ